MRERPCVEIRPDCVRGCVVHVAKGFEGVRHEGGHVQVLLISKLVKKMEIRSELIIEASQILGVPERRIVAPRQCLEWRRGIKRYAGKEILLGAFERTKVKELVLLERSAEACAILPAIEYGRWIADLVRCLVATVVEKPLTVHFIGAGSRRDGFCPRS